MCYFFSSDGSHIKEVGDGMADTVFIPTETPDTANID